MLKKNYTFYDIGGVWGSAIDYEQLRIWWLKSTITPPFFSVLSGGNLKANDKKSGKDLSTDTAL
jgi:hypothetical protein